jgi:molybdopterin/thiamine biosynthesis adenylyltransferase
LPDRDAQILVICQSGGRSMRAALVLQARGYTNVSSVAGGTTRWIAEGLPILVPAGDTDFYDRYSRHLKLPEVGEAGQRKLESARIAMIGAGGLGSPAAFYLAAAGIGTLLLADDDVVDRSNLQRQILHTDARIGVAKTESARIALSALNPRVRVEASAERVTSTNVERLLDGADVVIDGADNFAARYLLNDACVKLGKPLVYGAVHRFEGQVSVFDAGRRRGVAPCYRCLFPEPPPAEAAPNCAEAGVLGVLPGVIGLLQATEAIKLLLGIGTPLAGRLLHFDALGMRFRETRLAADPECPVCAIGKPFPGYIDYAAFCAQV